MAEEITESGFGPLRGLRVIDMTVAWAGPMAAKILAYLGAEVIHVEGPQRMDTWRDPIKGGDKRRYPQLDYGSEPYNRSVKFNSQNLGKRGLCLDLKDPRGRDVLLSLTAGSAALITNFTPGTLERLGIGVQTLHALNDNLVLVEMPAYGLFGPKSAQAGYGPTMEASCGMAGMIGYGDGRPYVTGPAYMDPIGAFNGAAAVLTGLMATSAGSRRGRHIDAAQCEAAMHWVGERLLESIDRSQSQSPEGNSVDYAEPHEAFPSRGTDEWVVISIGTDAEWELASTTLGIGHDDRFEDALGRRRHRQELYDVIAARTQELGKNEVSRRLQAAGIASAPVCDGEDVAKRADLWHGGYYQSIDQPSAGTSWYQGLPFRFGETLLEAPRPAPNFGQDNRHVLVDVLGLSDDEFSVLQSDGVVASEPAGRRSGQS